MINKQEKHEILVKACLNQVYIKNTNSIDRKKIRQIFDSLYKNDNSTINCYIEGTDWTPLMLCVWAGNSDGVKKLIRLGADITKSSKESPEYVSVNALHLAITAKKENIALLLLKVYPEIINQVTSHNQTPLMLACEAGLKKFVKKIMTIDNIDFDIKDINGNNFEDYCLKAKNNYIDMNTEVIESLINYSLLSRIVEKRDQKRNLKKI